MPIYEYIAPENGCARCGPGFEHLQTLSDDELRCCPDCGAPVRRKISAPNTKDVTLFTGTLTVDAAITKYLLVRVDNRIDAANEDVFPKGLSGASNSQITTTLGVVAKTK